MTWSYRIDSVETKYFVPAAGIGTDYETAAKTVDVRYQGEFIIEGVYIDPLGGVHPHVFHLDQGSSELQVRDLMRRVWLTRFSVELDDAPSDWGRRFKPSPEIVDRNRTRRLVPDGLIKGAMADSQVSEWRALDRRVFVVSE